MLSRLSGFTVIQILIATSIMGVLSATAFPAYDTYVKKSRLTEAITFAGAPKSRIAEYIMLNKRYPADLSEAGITPTSTDLIDTMELDDQGTLSLNLNKDKMGTSVTVAMKASFDTNGNVTWQCGVSGNVSYSISTCNDQTVEVYELTQEDKLEALSAELESINNKISQLTIEYDEFIIERNEMKSSLSKLQNALKVLNVEKSQITKDSSALRKRLIDLNKAFHKTASTTEKAKIQTQIDSLISRMSETNSALRSNTLAINDTKQQITSNKSAIDTLTQNINQVRDDINAAKADANKTIKDINAQKK